MRLITLPNLDAVSTEWGYMHNANHNGPSICTLVVIGRLAPKDAHI